MEEYVFWNDSQVPAPIPEFPLVEEATGNLLTQLAVDEFIRESGHSQERAKRISGGVLRRTTYRLIRLDSLQLASL